MKKKVYIIGGLAVILLLFLGALLLYKIRSQNHMLDLNSLTTTYQYPFGLITYTNEGFTPQILKLKSSSKARIVFINKSDHDVTIKSTTSNTSLNIGTIPHKKSGYFTVVYLSPGEYEYTNKKNIFQKGLIVIEK